jgi:hypothetical protein
MQPGRPDAPPSYGIAADPDGMLAWSWVEAQLTATRNYWLCTAGADGRPHAVPVWGLWLDGAVAFSTDPASRKGRNLAVDPRAVVHLESGDDVVVVEGQVVPLPSELVEVYRDSYEAKYGFRPDPAAAEGITYVLRPDRVLAWREQDFPTSATRWLLPPTA